jgi:hypothetical protein
MNITFRDIVWVGIIAIILIALSKCHRDKANELNSDVQALINERRIKDSINAVESQKAAKNLNMAIGKAQVAKEEQLTAEAKLEKSVATAKRLAAELHVLKGWPIDSTAITVSGEYVTYCDSLAFTADSLAVDFVRYKRTNTLLLKAKDTAYGQLSKMYNKQLTEALECSKDFKALQHFYTEADKRGKPTNQVFLGAELIGSQQLFVQNIGAVLSLKTRTNKLWQVSGGLQNGGGWYGRINGNILIRLRK